jgi:hypothetical protein
MDAMSQMAADVFVEMARDMPRAIPDPQPEANGTYPHAQVERELLPHAGPESSAGKSITTEWARQHAGQAALITTVALGGLARLRRRARRRGRA